MRQRGDVAAELVDAPPFDAFYGANRARLYAALCLSTGDGHEAEEIAQEAFLRVLERWPRVAGLDDPVGYLFVTAMNVFRKRLRRAQLAARLPIVHQVPEDALDGVHANDVVVRALRDLPPRQRAAIVLTTMLDMPSQEAARILRIKDSTVRALAKQARAQMRDSIGEDR